MPALKGVNKKLSFLFRKHKLVAFKARASNKQNRIMGSTSDVILSVALFHKRHPSLFQIPRCASIAPFTI